MGCDDVAGRLDINVRAAFAQVRANVRNVRQLIAGDRAPPVTLEAPEGCWARDARSGRAPCGRAACASRRSGEAHQKTGTRGRRKGVTRRRLNGHPQLQRQVDRGWLPRLGCEPRRGLSAAGLTWVDGAQLTRLIAMRLPRHGAQPGDLLILQPDERPVIVILRDGIDDPHVAGAVIGDGELRAWRWSSANRGWEGQVSWSSEPGTSAGIAWFPAERLRKLPEPSPDTTFDEWCAARRARRLPWE